MFVKKNIPILLILFRLLLAPVILLFAYQNLPFSRQIILALIFLGLLSDIFDGIIARNLNVASTSLRRMDSQVDMIFWVSVGFSSWLMNPDLLRPYSFFILMIFLTEISCYVVSYVRFKKETCTHAYLSKLWGITLLSAFASLIGFQHAGIPFFTAITIGILSHVDRILITLIIPEWTHDIPSCYHAYLIRKGKSFRKFKIFN